MTSNLTLHKIGKFKWLFLIAEIILIVYAFVALPENLLSLIGTILFLAGIYLGLDSFSDIERMTEKEKSFYSNQKLVKIQQTFLTVSIIILVAVSLLFISLKFIFYSNRSDLFAEFFELGLDCWALILGLLCMLKNTFDKQKFVRTE